jgi:hypothetical protein
MNAWLLTWEGTDRKISHDNKILAIVSSRRSSSFIKDVVDLLYCRSVDSAYYAARAANRKKQRHNEFMAVFSTPSRMFYGHNPLIFARRVADLKIVRNEVEGIEIVRWIDPPYFKIEKSGEMPVVADPERRCEVVRRLNAPLSRDLYVSV